MKLSIRTLAAPLLAAAFWFTTTSLFAVTATNGDGLHTTALTAAQTGTFTAQFDWSSTVSPINSLVGISAAVPTSYTNLAIIVRFNPSGFIDARNGGAYAAVASIPYVANTTYHFRVVANVAAHTYSAYVTAPGGSEQTIATNYAFRTEQNTVTSLGYWSLAVDPTPAGSTTALNFTLGSAAQVAAPTFSPGGGSYSSAQSVTITTTTSGASIRYTTDGSTPTSTTGTLYSGAVSISATTTLKAIAYASGMSDSNVATATYTISSGGVTATSGDGFHASTFATQSGTFTAQFDWVSSVSPINSLVCFSSGTPTSYTACATLIRLNPSSDIDARNGGAYAAASTIPYAAGVSYHFRVVVNVAAHTYSIYVTPAGGSELTVGANYAFRTEQNTVASLNTWSVACDPTPVGSTTVSNFSLSTTPQTAAPIFSPGGGTYSTAQSVTITSSTSGATIRYTTDGSTPTSSSGTIYASPVAIAATTTLKAIAYASGLLDSTVTSATYTINAGTGPFRPFPQHTAYATGTIKPNNVTQAAMDNAVKAKWDTWKANFLKPAGTGKYYVKFDSAGNTVSEAHGYGMLLTVLMAGYDASAKTYFDGLYNYFRAHPSQNNANLMAWKQNSSFQNVEGADSATDGDMDIAYALLLADKQWGSSGAINYLNEGKSVVNAIMASDVNQTKWNLKLGDWATGTQGDSTRPSDFMLEHLKAYKAATGDARWDNVAATTYNVINTIYNSYSPNTGLVCDFVVPNGSSWKPAPANFLESAHDGDYDYNSCRTPWRFPVDYFLTGDTRAVAEMQKMNSWVKAKVSSNAASIVDGYKLDGTAYGTGNSGAFYPPFGVCAMLDSSNQTWLNNVWARAAASGTETYYEESIKVLSMLVMSGNYWMP